MRRFKPGGTYDHSYVLTLRDRRDPSKRMRRRCPNARQVINILRELSAATDVLELTTAAIK